MKTLYCMDIKVEIGWIYQLILTDKGWALANELTGRSNYISACDFEISDYAQITKEEYDKSYQMNIAVGQEENDSFQAQNDLADYLESLVQKYKNNPMKEGDLK